MIDKVYGNAFKYQDDFDDTNTKQEIQFTQEEIVISGEEKWVNVRYGIRIFAAMDDYEIYDTITLADIGLTEAEGSYYIYVEAEWTEKDKLGTDHAYQLRFFIKDENSLVFCQEDYCVEYRRISYDGGSEDHFVIEPI